MEPVFYAPLRHRLSLMDPLFQLGDLIRAAVASAQSESLLQRALHIAAEIALADDCEPFFCGIDGCKVDITSLLQYERHVKGSHQLHKCSRCAQAFMSERLATLHAQEEHDTLFRLMAQKQDMYACLLESCSSRFTTSAGRRRHMIDAHSYPKSFHFGGDTGRRQKTEQKSIDVVGAGGGANVATVKEKQPCRFFATRSGCRNGKACPFKHDRGDRNAASKPEPSPSDMEVDDDGGLQAAFSSLSVRVPEDIAFGKRRGGRGGRGR